MLRLLECEETDEENDKGKVVRTIYEYSLGAKFDRDTVLALAGPPPPQRKTNACCGVARAEFQSGGRKCDYTEYQVRLKRCVYSHIRPALAFVSARKDGPNAQMSGLGGEAEFLCSTRALPVLTQVGHDRTAIGLPRGSTKVRFCLAP